MYKINTKLYERKKPRPTAMAAHTHPEQNIQNKLGKRALKSDLKSTVTATDFVTSPKCTLHHPKSDKNKYFFDINIEHAVLKC